MKSFYSGKNLIVITSLLILFTSCSKKDIDAPTNTRSNSGVISFSNQNISINNFQATEISKNDLNVSFSVVYTTNVSKIELLSGASQNQLCSFYAINVAGDSNSANTFSVNDTNIKGSTMYYMIKFTLADGDWGYTPVYSLQIK